jgi:hypothetical protein
MRLLLYCPEEEEQEKRRDGDEEVERDHGPTIRRRVAQGVSLRLRG